jgi:hypothetical protein
MTDVTAFSPARVFLSGLFRALFGAVIGLVAAVPVFIMVLESRGPHSATDTPIWLGVLVAALVGFASFCLLSSGIGRVISAFSRGCFLRAGSKGIRVRFPVQSWFGRFRLAEFELPWSEIAQVILFTYRISGIPSSTELRILLQDRKVLAIPRRYFSASPRKLQQTFLSIKAGAA